MIGFEQGFNFLPSLRKVGTRLVEIGFALHLGFDFKSTISNSDLTLAYEVIDYNVIGLSIVLLFHVPLTKCATHFCVLRW